MIEDRPTWTQPESHNQVTEAMTEIASQINQERALLACLERQYSFLSLMAHQITHTSSTPQVPAE